MKRSDYHAIVGFLVTQGHIALADKMAEELKDDEAPAVDEQEADDESDSMYEVTNSGFTAPTPETAISVKDAANLRRGLRKGPVLLNGWVFETSMKPLALHRSATIISDEVRDKLNIPILVAYRAGAAFKAQGAMINSEIPAVGEIVTKAELSGDTDLATLTFDSGKTIAIHVKSVKAVPEVGT